jgi:hypothetical protein
VPPPQVLPLMSERDSTSRSGSSSNSSSNSSREEECSGSGNSGGYSADYYSSVSESSNASICPEELLLHGSTTASDDGPNGPRSMQHQDYPAPAKSRQRATVATTRLATNHSRAAPHQQHGWIDLALVQAISASTATCTTEPWPLSASTALVTTTPVEAYHGLMEVRTRAAKTRTSVLLAHRVLSS